MKIEARAIILALLVSLSAALLERRSEVTPVQKVVQLLNGMRKKGEAEMQAEKVQFARYNQFCEDTSANKDAAIAEADERIGVLKADIQKDTVDAENLAREVTEANADMDTWNGDMKAATKVRQIEKADFDAVHKDYSESISALQRAINTLKRQNFDRAQADSSEAAFSQVAVVRQLKLVSRSNEATLALDQFLARQEDPTGLDVRAPEAHGYEFQSSGIIEILEGLHTKFMDERKQAEQKESASKHAYEMLMQDLESSVKRAEDSVHQKTRTRATKLEHKADATGELQLTTSTRDEDHTYVTELKTTCSQKATDFASRQKLRQEELEAIDQAVEIISSGAVSGAADKHLPGFLQQRNGPVYGQLRAETGMKSQLRALNALQFLRSRATALKSRLLSALVARSNNDPFQKVRAMIKDLVVRLMEEANEEATHKGWCDTELATNGATRQEKTDAVESLKAEIERLTAAISRGTEEIADLTTAISELDKAATEATEMRHAEEAKNEETITDAQEAEAAVAQALLVLKEFYAKAGQATALVQRDQPEAPEIFDAPYQGMQAENGGVLGMLEVVQTDFARLEAETTAAEAAAVKEYETFMSETKVDKASKLSDLDHKTSKKQDDKQSLGKAQEDLEGTQKELDAALEYFDKLKPSCLDAAVSYEDRVARRKAEMESLQEALKILDGELP